MNKMRLRSRCRNMADAQLREIRLGLKQVPAITNIPSKPEFFSELIRLTHPLAR